MYTAKQVSDKLAELKASGIPAQQVAWKLALLCVGWAYVFGARGVYCDPVNRRNAYASHGAEHPTIKTACRNFNGSDKAACPSCKWYPGGRTRVYDCRGFTYWVLKQVYGWTLTGAGATSQWDTAANWKAKGTVAEGLPADTLVCLFVRKGTKMSHTGFGYNNETVECSNGVQHFTTRNKKWTHWAVPVCIDGDVPAPTPTPTDDKPTLKRGSKGSYVTLAQTQLINKGYSLEPYGADGSFGKVTEAAVKAFQKAHGLAQDGVIGHDTWQALCGAEPAITYTVTVKGLTESQADALVKQYPNSEKTQERG